MYHLRLLKIAERDSGKSNTEEYGRRNIEEGIIILLRITPTRIITEKDLDNRKRSRWFGLL